MQRSANAAHYASFRTAPVGFRYAAFSSCDAARTDEVGPRGNFATGVSASRDCWRYLIQIPARCFVSARRTAQRDPLMLEVQQRVVPMKAAEHLTQRIEHAGTQSVRLTELGGHGHRVVRRD